MAEQLFEYTPTCHLAIAGDFYAGEMPKHYHPDTPENLAAGLATRLELTEAEASRFGTDLRKLGPAEASKAAEPELNKQVTATQTK